MSGVLIIGGIIVVLFLFEGLARGLGVLPGKTLGNWNVTNWNDDTGPRDRRNIAAAYIGSLSDTKSNREAIARLKGEEEG